MKYLKERIGISSMVDILLIKSWFAKELCQLALPPAVYEKSLKVLDYLESVLDYNIGWGKNLSISIWYANWADKSTTQDVFVPLNCGFLQPSETSGPDGALHRQHRVQDWCCDSEAWDHGASQTEEKGGAGKAAGWSGWG